MKSTTKELLTNVNIALWLYRYSIAYVGLLFFAMMIDRLIVLG